MAIFQTILALIGRSLGRIVTALFGWAVVALFGQTSAHEKLWLSGLVAAAAAWPLLIVGVMWPRLAALVLAFVAVPRWVPAWTIRVIWLALAICVPFAVGIAVAVRARGPAAPIPGTRLGAGRGIAPPASAMVSPLKESRTVRLLRGIPITAAVAASFLIVFVTVPVRRLMSLARRRVNVSLPLVTDAAGYAEVAREVEVTLAAHRIHVSRTQPEWDVTLPARILLVLGGPGFRGYVPEHYARFRGAQLDIVMYPSALSMTGSERDTARAHGLLAEALTAAPAYQTFDPDAQNIERQIRSVWAAFRQNPAAHAGAPRLLARLHEISRDIGELAVDYEEWQVVYRQALQLDRALREEPQFLEGNAEMMSDAVRERPDEEVVMPHISNANDTRQRSTRELVGEISAKTVLLARKEIDLAAAEIKADLKSELAMAKGLGVAALLGLLGVNLLLVALVFALTAYIAGWLAAILLGGGLILVAAVLGYIGWARHITHPLPLTRKTLRDTVQWAKERLA